MEKNKDNNENIEQEQPVVKELIKPKYKKKLKKLLEVAVFAIIAGLIFGLVARFVLSSSTVGNLLGIEEKTDEKPSPTPVRSAVTFPSISDTIQKKEEEVSKQVVSFASNLSAEDGKVITGAENNGQTDEDKPDNTPVLKPSVTPVPEIPDEKNPSADETDGSKNQDRSGVTGIVTLGRDGMTDQNDDGRESAETDPENQGKTMDGSEADPSGQNTEDGNGSTEPEDGESADGNGAVENPDEQGNADGSSVMISENDDGTLIVIGSEDGQTSGELFGISSISSYREVMDELHQLALKTEKSMILINAVTNIANWMSDGMESRESTTGIIVADNGVELLAVTYYDKVKSADHLEIVLSNGNVYDGSLLSFDAEYNMAVVAIPLSSLSDEDRESAYAVRFGDTSELYSGMPVIALGSPNGNVDSIEYGYITGKGQKMYLLDGVCTLFTTDITNNSDSEGIIINLDGDLIGIISRHTAAAELTGTSTEIYIDSLIPVALKLCNSQKRPYFGVKTEDIPENILKDMNLDNGIYVNEVIEGSPAEIAEIHKGDIIISMNGEKVTSVQQFSDILMKGIEENGYEVEIFRSSRKSEPVIKAVVQPVV